jgi:P27 family predicted phage terminase small subunit
MAAPKPRPAALKLLNGDRPGRDSGGRKVTPPPSFVRTAPPPPTWLPVEAKAEWKRIVPELDRLDLLKQASRSALTAYCLTWWRLVEAQKLIQVEGVIGTNSQGRVRHPAVAVAEAASKELRGWCSEFGLTPSAEGKLKVSEVEDGDDFD